MERVPWTADERILALDVYLRRGQVDPADPEVVELSDLMRSLPLHQPPPSSPTFRNPNGVSLKMANFAALDPGYPGVGMTSYSRADAETWNRFGSDPELVAKLAATIKAKADEAIVPEPTDEEAEVEEGAILYRLHRLRERNRRLVDKAKKTAMEAHSALACEVCGYDFSVAYGSLGFGYIEAHHKVPLSELGTTRTSASDLALLCANCHRVAHRQKPWPSVEELREAWTGRFR